MSLLPLRKGHKGSQAPLAHAHLGSMCLSSSQILHALMSLQMRLFIPYFRDLGVGGRNVTERWPPLWKLGTMIFERNLSWSGGCHAATLVLSTPVISEDRKTRGENTKKQQQAQHFFFLSLRGPWVGVALHPLSKISMVGPGGRSIKNPSVINHWNSLVKTTRGLC